VTHEMTEAEAIAFHDSKVWETWTDHQVVELQLFQSRLCVRFDRFHQAIEKVLGRPVWTHEFADKARLQAEYRARIGEAQS
jgi:hypothetical protein